MDLDAPLPKEQKVLIASADPDKIKALRREVCRATENRVNVEWNIAELATIRMTAKNFGKAQTRGEGSLSRWPRVSQCSQMYLRPERPQAQVLPTEDDQYIARGQYMLRYQRLLRARGEAWDDNFDPQFIEEDLRRNPIQAPRPDCLQCRRHQKCEECAGKAQP